MAKKRLPPKQPMQAVNPQLGDLGKVQSRLAELKAEEAKVVQTIRSAFREAVIVFVDMVESTKFKIDHSTDPETWIRRVFLFSAIVTEYVEALGGRVIKYIGDEVMAAFDQPSCVNEANSLVARIAEIEAKLKDVIGVETRVKIAIDKGPVCFLSFSGHEQTDPQGTPVDRCARIAKHTKAGVVLASHEFVRACPPTFSWLEVGEVELKGLGTTLVYQMGEKTVDLTPLREIREDEYRRLNERVADAEKGEQQVALENEHLRQMNEGLQEQIRGLGQVPSEEQSLLDEEEEDADGWTQVEEVIESLRELIDKAPAPVEQYARFLFLDRSGHADTYDRYERKFDECIEANLVSSDGEGNFRLNHDHPRNMRVLQLIDRLDESLSKYSVPSGELFSYSVDDPEFWHKKIGYYVQ